MVQPISCGVNSFATPLEFVREIPSCGLVSAMHAGPYMKLKHQISQAISVMTLDNNSDLGDTVAEPDAKQILTMA